MYRLLAIAFVAIVAMMLLARAIMPAEAGPADKAVEAGASPSAAPAMAREGRSTVIQRDASGQFYLTASANGQPTRFLIDTGADMVAITVADAEGMNLDIDPAGFQPIGQTASGVGYGAPIALESLEVAGAEFQNVEAVVIDGLETNLLGQSVLSRFGKVEMRGDTMVIHHAS